MTELTQLTALYELPSSILCSLSSVLRSVEHAHDVGFLHDQEILAVELHLGAGPFSEQHFIANLEIDGDQLADIVATAGAGRHDLALLRLLARGIRNDDAAGGLFLGFDALHDHSVVQRTELGFRHGDLVAAQQRALGMIEREWAVSTQLYRVPKLSGNMALGANCQAAAAQDAQRQLVGLPEAADRAQ